MSETFKKLSGIDLKGKLEEKDGLSYLSWANAWDCVMKHDPEASYEIVMNGEAPYFNDPLIGVLVRTNVTIDGVTRQMWLAVVDHSNKALKSEPYKVTKAVWKKEGGRSRKVGTEEVEVPSATMVDVNKAIMRCLTKNIAMFGLGLYVYAGEEYPIEDPVVKGKGRKIVRDDEDEDELPELKLGNKYWNKSITYVRENRKTPVKDVITQLKRKYNMTKETVKIIEKIHEERT